MNPSSSFTFLPNPNSNPNPFHHHPPPPFTSGTTTTVAPPPPDLSATLSTLNHLIHLSQTTIQSLTTLLPTIPTAAPHLSTCPFNPTHRLPPPYLFRHFLQCPSSPLPVDSTSILNSLHYPTSLQSNHPKPFLQTLPDTDPNHDLCFSLDEYPTSLPPNFFYLSCPAVVSFPDDHDPTTTTNRMLTVPVVLSAECANFTGSDISCLSIEYATKLFPSEAWGVRNEIRAWNDYPAYYSFGVARSILCLYKCSFSCGLQEWLIVNSPRYGIVIDLPMSNHILLLLRLCLKAVIREAIASLGYQSGVKVIHCPVLVRVLEWLGSQLSLLFGEFNGKLFAIDMFKQFMIFAQSSCLMFSEGEKDKPCLGLGAEDKKCEELLKGKAKQEKPWVIYVSQVAAAVAALHERAMLERKLKAMRDLRPLTNYQRVAEHDLESRKADEQRKKRLNYRPILEHDGLLWQRAHNEGANRTKSKAELLAEERDYKRRRTSYRGKKIKRNATHVMRDIIEDYMEEIKQAGGIGCLVKGAEVSGVRACQSFDVPGMSTDDEARIRSPKSFELNKGRREGYNQQLDSDNSIRSTRYEDESTEGNMLERDDSHRKKGHLEAHSTDRKRHDRAYYRSADGQTSNSGSREKRVNNEARKYFPPSPDGGRCQSHEKISHHYDRIHQSVGRKDSSRRKADRNDRSNSAVHHEFEDRYDPSES